MTDIGYQNVYHKTFEAAEAIASALGDAPSHVINTMFAQAGTPGIKALFDALVDKGMRNALAEALKSPALSGAVREQLEGCLYGQAKQASFLLSRQALH